MTRPHPYRLRPAQQPPASEGVLAIITIMVLDLRTPEEHGWADALHQWPRFACSALSFVYIGISWNNHHHLHTVRRINGRVMWANLHLWLSRLPLLTSRVGESRCAVRADGTVRSHDPDGGPRISAADARDHPQ